MVALEARAAGKPLLVSSLGGLPELVEDRRDGWIIPAGDPEAWGECIALLAADRRRVTDAAAHSLPPGSAESMAGAYLQAYSSILGKETVRPALTTAHPVEENVSSRRESRAESTAATTAKDGAQDG